MDLKDTTKAIIDYLSLDYKEIPHVLSMAERTVPKYKGSVQPFQAAFLYWLTARYVPTYGDILEVGTGLGYTSLVMAIAKPSAVINTLNPNNEECKIARKILEGNKNVSVNNVDSREWYAYQTGEDLYDLIFVDGDHKDIEFDCKWYDHLTDNGVIVFHDYSPLGSWAACPPVFDHLNLKRLEWGEPTHLVRDRGNVGMIAWRRGLPGQTLELEIENFALNLSPA